MTIPHWLIFLVAVWVIAFGVFRIAIGLKQRPKDEDPDRPNFRRKGLYARSPRSHVVLGAVYVALGAALVAMGLGWLPAIDSAGCLGDRAAGGQQGQSVDPDSPAGAAPASR